MAWGDASQLAFQRVSAGVNADALCISQVESRQDCQAAGRLFDAVWRVSNMVPNETLIATLHAGGYASLATLEGVVVGASWGFLARRNGELGLHSHVTGVLPSHAGLGVGAALKYHQWRWAKREQLSFVTWTFDPLVRRNAYFNLVKLGATITEFHEDFYGDITDGINQGEHTDRVFVEWVVSQDAPEPACGAVAQRAHWSIETPEDIESLRKVDPSAARTWRSRQRADLQKAFAGGWRISGLMNDGSYAVVRR